jgi:succinylglutamate desuccinylase
MEPKNGAESTPASRAQNLCARLFHFRVGPKQRWSPRDLERVMMRLDDIEDLLLRLLKEHDRLKALLVYEATRSVTPDTATSFPGQDLDHPL